MSTRLCVTMKLALFMLGGAAAKSLVPGAHPALKARFAKNEALTAADFDDASKVPMKRAVPRVAPARLGSISYNKSVEECAQFTSTTECYDGNWNGDDDDVIVGSGSSPAACAMCGFSDFSAGEVTYAFSNCVICDANTTLMVVYDDCSGVCAADAAVDYYSRLGFGNLDTSACVAHGNCYPDDASIFTALMGGTNANFVTSSYSYSYSYGDDDHSYSYGDDHHDHHDNHDDDALAHDSCAESAGNFLCSHDPNYRTTCEEGTSGMPPTCEDGSRACCCDVDGTCVDGDDDWCCHGDEYEDTPCADCCDGGALRRARRALKFGMHTVSGGDGAKDAGDCATCAC